MEQRTLQAMLEQLHGELQLVHSLNDDEKALLRQVQDDIVQIIEPGPGNFKPDPAEHEQSKGRLREAVMEFESSHPRLASTLEGMLNALSNSGF